MPSDYADSHIANKTNKEVRHSRAKVLKWRTFFLYQIQLTLLQEDYF